MIGSEPIAGPLSGKTLLVIACVCMISLCATAILAHSAEDDRMADRATFAATISLLLGLLAVGAAIYTA